MNSLSIDFELIDDVWWERLEKVPEALGKITQLKERIEQCQSTGDTKIIQEYANIIFYFYIKEVLYREENRPILDFDNEELQFNDRIKNPKNKKDQKLSNLHNTIKNEFQGFFFLKLPIERFNFAYAINIHKAIGHGLIENCGELRKHDAKPAGIDTKYLEHEQIENELNKLFRDTVKLAQECSNDLEKMIKLGAQFLSRFLYIHPFSNGNGRVARILLSYLLSHVSVVPIPLFDDKKSRENYLKCLEESQRDQSFKCEALATFILDCMSKCLQNIAFAIEI